MFSCFLESLKICVVFSVISFAWEYLLGLVVFLGIMCMVLIEKIHYAARRGHPEGGVERETKKGEKKEERKKRELLVIRRGKKIEGKQ